jgi:glycosyltransferase involved in cell wall biosynthesis
MKLFLFTNNFPYGQGESFLANEFPFLEKSFEKIAVIPLFPENETRPTAGNVEVWDTILGFNPKERKKLLLKGIFNFSPSFRFFSEFFRKKVFRNRKHFWNFFTSLLLFRAIFSRKTIWKKLFSEIQPEDRLYFYWSDKTVFILPCLKSKIANKAIVRFHGGDLYEERKNGYIPFRKFIFSSIDCFVTVSENGKDYLIEKYSEIINKEKIKVSRLGVFDNGLNPMGSEKFHLLSCSNMISLKRIDLIIIALKNISFPIKWTHIGTGILENELKTLAKSLPENVETEFKGAMKNLQVIEYYQNTPIDLFINVSESEGVPVSIMEVLSFGIPVLATDVGGTAEIIDNQVGKLLKKDLKPAEISQEINVFSKTNLSELRKNARQRWTERCDAEKNYSEFTKLLFQ